MCVCVLLSTAPHLSGPSECLLQLGSPPNPRYSSGSGAPHSIQCLCLCSDTLGDDLRGHLAQGQYLLPTPPRDTTFLGSSYPSGEELRGQVNVSLKGLGFTTKGQILSPRRLERGKGKCDFLGWPKAQFPRSPCFSLRRRDLGYPHLCPTLPETFSGPWEVDMSFWFMTVMGAYVHPLTLSCSWPPHLPSRSGRCWGQIRLCVHEAWVQGPTLLSLPVMAGSNP